MFAPGPVFCTTRRLTEPRAGTPSASEGTPRPRHHQPRGYPDATDVENTEEGWASRLGRHPVADGTEKGPKGRGHGAALRVARMTSGLAQAARVPRATTPAHSAQTDGGATLRLARARTVNAGLGVPPVISRKRGLEYTARREKIYSRVSQLTLCSSQHVCTWTRVLPRAPLDRSPLRNAERL